MSLLTEEQEVIRQEVRRFAEQEVIPIADPLYREQQEIPTDLIKKMAELGYFGAIFPPEYGGSGMDYVSMAIITEELSRGWLSVGSVMTRSLITGTLILANGTEEQKKRFLPGLAKGEILSAAAFTEPEAGSDAASAKLQAKRDGDGYRLTGAKTWCTFANKAHILTVLARTNPDPASRHRGLSLFLVEKEPGDQFMPPSIAGTPIPTVGYYGMKSFSLSFEDCYVPKANLIGEEENKGFYQLMASYESARIQTAARGVGVAQAAFEAALKYSKERVQFGQPISNFQAIRFKLADMAIEIEAARQLLYYVCSLKNKGIRCDLEAGMAKIFSSEMAERVTAEAMQVFGGYGYSTELPLHRYWRDARVLRIFEGTNEIQRDVIARRLLEK
ncbi:MAG: acyl-CoA dehydrogenase family protein [Candidatus Tectomicrobia bacterium]|nr:acyl-CoA dehydrogenase family protein [Candidatus Tectomicrobia bacterium]